MSETKTTKMTKTQKFETIINYLENAYDRALDDVADMGAETAQWKEGDEAKELDMCIEFCKAEIAAIAARAEKNKSKKSPAQIKKEEEQNEIIGYMFEVMDKAEGPITIGEMQKQNEILSNYTNQKLSALLRKMIEAGEAQRDTKGGKAVFSLVDMADSDENEAESIETE